ncbi:MAG TPA: hypothetical protein VGO69_01200 [Pyrinomonadaceae bacterium]|jgi:hypothetical protein|nr:hypothetical protein [Pyrinomonadaceae bacterium]
MSLQLGQFVLVALEEPGVFIFSFHFDHFPRSIKQVARANWEAQDVTIGVKPLAYGNREPLRIVVDELWLDKTDTNESLRADIDKLRSFQVERQLTGRPPALLVLWGDNQERVVLEEITIDETFFTPAGEPIRARVSLQFLELQEDGEAVNVTIREDIDSGSGIGDF